MSLRFTAEEAKKIMPKYAAQLDAKLGYVESANKGNKYLNKKAYVYADGYAFPQKAEGHGRLAMVFDSTKEYHRWIELNQLQKLGAVANLKRQEKFLIQEAFAREGERIAEINYKADFVYEDTETGKTVVEDVKPFDAKTGQYRCTKDFLIKWKLLKWKYPEYIFRLY